MLSCLKSLFTQVHKNKYTNVLSWKRWRWRWSRNRNPVACDCCAQVLSSLLTRDYRSKILKRLSGYLTLGVQSAGFVPISCEPTCAGECLSVRPDQEHPHELCFWWCQSQREVSIQNLKCDLDLTYLLHRIISLNNCVCRIIDLIVMVYVCVP